MTTNNAHQKLAFPFFACLITKKQGFDDRRGFPWFSLGSLNRVCGK